MLRVLDLFSGIGGFSLGLERAGFRTVAFCEIEPFARRVLRKHWPDVSCHEDITTRDFQEGEADVVCGGFPCQDVSFAGRRAGLAGARSGLYRELVRAIRVVRPRVAIVENVAALLSDGMGTVLGDLAEGGACVEWDCVPASAIGAPHQRDRVWIVAHADSERWGEAGQLRHQPLEVPPRRTEARPAAGDASNPASIGRRQGRPWGPPDSFARVRDEARRNAADPYGGRIAFNERVTGKRSIWPDEPPLSRMDDGDAYWLDRVRATGNQVVPQIPELIGLALLDSDALMEG